MYIEINAKLYLIDILDQQIESLIGIYNDQDTHYMMKGKTKVGPTAAH